MADYFLVVPMEVLEREEEVEMQLPYMQRRSLGTYRQKQLLTPEQKQSLTELPKASGVTHKTSRKSTETDTPLTDQPQIQRGRSMLMRVPNAHFRCSGRSPAVFTSFSFVDIVLWCSDDTPLFAYEYNYLSAFYHHQHRTDYFGTLTRLWLVH